jgi:hypothetical protein
MTSSTSPDLFLPEYESLPAWLFIPFVLVSLVESIIGVVGNILVILVLLFSAKSSTSQTSHHYFIINLALSDFVLCLFTMPLNTYRSLYIYMTFPPAFCKLTDSFPAINICVSSLTIVTISIYRYCLVCYPHQRCLGTLSTFLIMISIWLLAIGAASPLFIYSRSIPAYDQNLIENMLEVVCHSSTDKSCERTHAKIYQRFHVCHESWPPYGELRLLYTIFMLFLQFLLPILIICLTYYQVMVKLRERKYLSRFREQRTSIAVQRSSRATMLVGRVAERNRITCATACHPRTRVSFFVSRATDIVDRFDLTSRVLSKSTNIDEPRSTSGRVTSVRLCHSSLSVFDCAQQLLVRFIAIDSAARRSRASHRRSRLACLPESNATRTRPLSHLNDALL